MTEKKNVYCVGETAALLSAGSVLNQFSRLLLDDLLYNQVRLQSEQSKTTRLHHKKHIKVSLRPSLDLFLWVSQ